MLYVNTKNIHDEEEIKKIFNKISASNFIEFIHNYSVIIFKNKNTEFRGVYYSSFHLYNKDFVKIANQEVLITAWDLIDLSYYTILFSNDNGSTIINDEEELSFLFAVIKDYTGKKEKKFLKDNKGKRTEILLYLYGFLGEQLNFQITSFTLKSLVRELYILNECISKHVISYDFDQIVKNVIGLNQEDLVGSLLFLWVISINYSNIDLGISKSKICNDFKNMLNSTLDYYSIDYEGVRKSNIGRQVFYTKPYVVNQQKIHLSINVYLNLYIVTHSIMWIVRDFYNLNNNCQNFINDFGIGFEIYFKELLEDTLNDNEYKRITNVKEKHADWILSLGKYNFIIEQKSSLLYLNVKQQITDIDKMKAFAKNTIIKAIEQLHSTEVSLNLSKPIKIILLYEEYLRPEIIDQIFDLEDCHISNDNLYWLVTINEMEILLNLYKENRDKFYQIMEKKLDLEFNHPNDGRGFDFIFNKEKITSNYLKKDKFHKYNQIANMEKIKKYFL